MGVQPAVSEVVLCSPRPNFYNIHFLRFQNQEFAAIFDLPHPLKCTYSFILKHHVANVECEITANGEQLTGTTKWEDKLKAYEVDKYIVYYLLMKVT
jgi:hypothetical protein